jgi:hypothetical protein
VTARAFVAGTLARLILVMAVVATGALAARAFAHNWYDPWCCNLRDCGPVPEGTSVLQDEDGAWVTFPGQAPRRFERASYRPSQDRRVHTCIYQEQNRCLYLPMGM